MAKKDKKITNNKIYRNGNNDQIFINEALPRFKRQLLWRPSISDSESGRDGSASPGRTRLFRKVRPEVQEHGGSSVSGRGKGRKRSVSATHQETEPLVAETPRKGGKKKRGKARSPLCSEEDTDVAMSAGEDRAPQVEGPSNRELKELPASDIAQLVLRHMDDVRHVADRSACLKGTFVRSLKEAEKEVRRAASELSCRSATEENMRLMAENHRLSVRVDLLSQEVAALKEMVKSLPEHSRPAETGSEVGSEFDRRMADFRLFWDARLGAIEARLPPEPRIRPPLAADKTKGVAQPAPTLEATVPPASTPSSAPTSSTPGDGKAAKGKGKGKGKGKKTGGGVVPLHEPDPAPSQTVGGLSAAPPVPAPLTEGWNIVARKRKKKGAKAAEPAQTTVAVVAKPPSKKQEKAAIPLRPPSTAAIILTMSQDAVGRGATYAEVIARAKQNIVLADHGISGIAKICVAATGARKMEIPGPDAEKKADSLAEKLREVLRGDAIVSRPYKCVDIRVRGLDDSVTPEEVARAISRAGGCPVDAVKVGVVRSGPRGEGTAWAKCPIPAAKKVAVARRLLVGWVSARISVAEARQMRCFRCLGAGHTRAMCDSECDRSDICYRCGQAGHKVGQCSAAPRCVLCAEAKLPAEHRLGGPSCRAPKPKKKGVNASQKTGGKAPQNIKSGQPSRAGEAMELGN
ncbi:uncharacterized protein LOC142986584 [Anticarsia gemmatalis]|uniref:uncharacterized protein LOC142986584 n=1 Tax=Anticarsia gemmatalis TaxID=129554 RepID=UPI003F75D397